MMNFNNYKVTFDDNKVYVLNYKSVLDINDAEALIKLYNKILKIYGSDMKLIKMDKSELLISGQINKIELV